jgi:hypothetical protein
VSDLPFVFLGLRTCAESNDLRTGDSLTSEDPLPARLEMKKEGVVLARNTRMTKMKPETTDDN